MNAEGRNKMPLVFRVHRSDFLVLFNADRRRSSRIFVCILLRG